MTKWKKFHKKSRTRKNFGIAPCWVKLLNLLNLLKPVKRATTMILVHLKTKCKCLRFIYFFVFIDLDMFFYYDLINMMMIWWWLFTSSSHHLPLTAVLFLVGAKILILQEIENNKILHIYPVYLLINYIYNSILYSCIQECERENLWRKIWKFRPLLHYSPKLAERRPTSISISVIMDLSIYLSIYQFLHISIYIHIYIYLSFVLCIFPSFYPSIYKIMNQSTYLHISDYQSIYLSIYLLIYLYIYLAFSIEIDDLYIFLCIHFSFNKAF